MNGVMLQAFEWYLPADGKHWQRLGRQARRLRRMGFTALWLPPAYKGAGGAADVGYGVYDPYDLGEFRQKGTVRTKYGTKRAYLRAIRRLRLAGLNVLCDVVLNQRLGADEPETFPARRVDEADRRRVAPEAEEITAHTRFTFPGRRGRYSAFAWDHRRFTGVDVRRGDGWALYLLSGKRWAEDVDGENGNYDYLMGADVDVNDPEVREELMRWGAWYLAQTRCDGFRLDAVKHISAAFMRDWLGQMRRLAGRELFAVGEYWQYDVSPLLRYLGQVEECMSLFDVPLHKRFHDVSHSGGGFDMRALFEGTLVGCRPHLAVTFVDNHDTQPGQALESWVEGWFKAAAYGLILLRSFGYPCVFWGDLTGIPHDAIGAVSELPALLRLRRENALGPERDYFDHPQLLGFTRQGEAATPGSGLAFLCTSGEGGEKRMCVGTAHAGRRFRCALGGQADVMIGGEGWGVFRVGGGGMSVYVPRLTLGERLRRIFCRR